MGQCEFSYDVLLRNWKYYLQGLPYTSLVDLLKMARVYDVSSIGYQLQNERMPKAAAVAGSKVVAFPRRE